VCKRNGCRGEKPQTGTTTLVFLDETGLTPKWPALWPWRPRRPCVQNVPGHGQPHRHCRATPGSSRLPGSWWPMICPLPGLSSSNACPDLSARLSGHADNLLPQEVHLTAAVERLPEPNSCVPPPPPPQSAPYIPTMQSSSNCLRQLNPLRPGTHYPSAPWSKTCACRNSTPSPKPLANVFTHWNSAPSNSHCSRAADVTLRETRRQRASKTNAGQGLLKKDTDECCLSAGN